MTAARDRDLVPLTVEARLATADEDSVDILAIAAVWEGRRLITMVKAQLPSNGEKPTLPRTLTLQLEDAEQRLACARALLPEAPEQVIERLAARLEAGVDTVNLALIETKKRPKADDTAEEKDEQVYKVANNRIYYRGQGGWQPLTNFVADIKEEVIADDGAEEKRYLEIHGRLSTGRDLGDARIPLSAFPGMTWPVTTWGPSAVVSAGMGTKDRVREAIQVLSPDVPRRHAYTHTGWRHRSGVDYFLHAGGAIGPNGPAPDITVELQGTLSLVALPNPPTGNDLHEAVWASLCLRDIAHDTITVPGLGTVYRAPLCDAQVLDMSTFFLGASGGLKTSLTALLQAHFGAAFNDRQLPGAWTSTGNQLEKLAFLAKDVVFTIDDFVPGESPLETARARANADRVLRAIGNHAGRGRMNADGSLRPTYVPRGAVISSGEELPVGHSLGARFLIVDVPPGGLTTAKISAPQALAEQGIYAAAMAGYIQWLARDYAGIRQQVRACFEELRAASQTDGVHLRMPASMAHLLLGWEFFLRFAVECGAISEAAKGRYMDRAQEALATLVARTAGQVATQEPAKRFVTLLASVLATGKAHLLGVDGGMPAAAELWGWRSRTVGENLAIEPATREHIGWLDGDDVYLEPDAAYAAVHRLVRDQANGGLLTPRTLWKRLHERGYLASWDEARKRHLVRKTVQGQRFEVLHLYASTLLHRASCAEESPQTSQSTQNGGTEAPRTPEDQPGRPPEWAVFGAEPSKNGPENGPNREENGANGHEDSPDWVGHTTSPPSDEPTSAPSGPFLWDENGPPGGKNGPISAPKSGESTREEETDGPIGPIGPIIGTHRAPSREDRSCVAGYVRNVSRDPRAPRHPTEPCAAGHHEWEFARSGSFGGDGLSDVRWYGYVCRECRPVDQYGCSLPREAYCELQDEHGAAATGDVHGEDGDHA